MKNLIKNIKRLYWRIRYGVLKAVVVDKFHEQPTEIAFYDKSGCIVAYWAYGYFDPAFPICPDYLKQVDYVFVDKHPCFE